MPPVEEVTAELKIRRERAIKLYNRAGKTGPTRKSKTTNPDDNSEISQEIEAVSESGTDPFVGGPYFDAVNLGQGWRGYLMGIGFEESYTDADTGCGRQLLLRTRISRRPGGPQG